MCFYLLTGEQEDGNPERIAPSFVTFLTVKDCNFRKHITTATYMNMFAGVENTPLYPRNIPNEATFQTNARGSAVNSNDHVVIYENTGMFGYFMGARTWWMFKVCIQGGVWRLGMSPLYDLSMFLSPGIGQNTPRDEIFFD